MTDSLPSVRSARLLLFTLLLATAACGIEAERSRTTDDEGGFDMSEVAFAPETDVDLDAMERRPSDLYAEELEEGDGAAAETGRPVTVHYTGWLPDGTRFDSSRDAGRPFQFTLGAGQVIPGWDQGVEGMREGGVRRLVIPPGLAYGSQGAGGVIPPNSPLVFEVELLEVGGG